MKAAVYYGNQDLRIERVSEPREPKNDEVLLEVLRVGICGTDVAEYLYGPKFTPLVKAHPASGHLGPMTIGHEFMGRVLVVGANVNKVKVGQRVVSGAGVSNCLRAMGERCDWCKRGKTNLCSHYFTYGLNAPGALAEKVLALADCCYPIPDDLSDNAAAMAQPTAVALHSVRRSGVQENQTIAVQGIGGVGAFALGALAFKGFGPITAIDIDDERLAMAKKLGAAHTINAAKEDVVETIKTLTDGAGVHVFFETSGVSQGPSLALEATRRGGTVMIVGLQKTPVELDLYTTVLREIDLKTSLAHVFKEDIPEAVEMLRTTSFADTVLDRVIGLDDVLDGLRAIRANEAKGKVLVDVRRNA